MAEPTTPAAEPEPESTTEPTVTPEASTEPQGTPEGDARVAALSAEAKKYRLRSKEAEQRVGQLQSRVDSHDRDAALRIAAERLTDPEDLFLAHGIADLRDPETGNFSETLTRAALDGVAASHPHWLSPLGQHDSGQGVRRPLRQPESFGTKLKGMV